ncbi:TlpA disulfide reductase family protein [Sphingobacterium sp. DR205]|uniref:TlpA family protein disulfide reductase n=1 Tax=Sphingobacterium sp. DR205 TaxID=2713573 RepID=UPI0013E43F6E|nr:TlpA disulfide reductase family protein [Sphingobacterium sp. DR205]QIH33836.1 TlpA family protein disulfide reductase [Sphingobacterium sp. DR205]
MITITVFYCISSIGAKAQSSYSTTSNKQLKVGDPIPIFNLINPENIMGKNVDLKNMDKVVLLDFFDTYCTACIASLPKLKKLQNEMSDKTQIILVTWQDQKTISKFWQTNAFIKEHRIDLPILYADTLLKSYFPHRSIPHAVWIFKEKVRAITHSDFITAENVQSLYQQGDIKLPLKNDFVDEKPDMRSLDSAGIYNTIIRYSHFQDGRPASSYKYQLDSLTGYYSSSFINQPIFAAYTAIWSKIRKPEFLLKPERLLWTVSDSNRYKNFGGPGTGQVWLSKNGISYERFDRNQRNDSIQAKIVLNDLNNLLNIDVKWTKRKRMAWVIKGKYKPSREKLVGQSLEGTGVLAFILDLADKYPVAIDQVKIKDKIILPEFGSLNDLNQILGYYGLKIVEEECLIDVLEFRERN